MRSWYSIHSYHPATLSSARSESWPTASDEEAAAAPAAAAVSVSRCGTTGGVTGGVTGATNGAVTSAVTGDATDSTEIYKRIAKDGKREAS